MGETPIKAEEYVYAFLNTDPHPLHARDATECKKRKHPQTRKGLLLLKRGGHPVQALVQTISRGGAGGLDVPVALAQRVESELVGDLRSVHRVGQVLLVGEDEQNRLAELILVQHAVELVASLADAVAIVGVHDEDDALRVLVVVAPQGPDLVLPAHVPHGEGDVLVLNRLHVEADRGDGGDDLAKLELVENGGLARGVKAHHEDAHILLAEELAEKLRERETHGSWKCFLTSAPHPHDRLQRGDG
eukprot:CAMPEP_0113240970 /NCGR_PEP_ID=MMETSP0008_2-20120614/6546_1 /TAXON_ID=97485 /ORGANISM="Prymnesium parvum" /LENGTH=245 /DNA_ID=CAMNT_0000088345 /DNA_START=136 /DNA_END=874 /DNA_ORIENTATION=- /assembly_acc=CAM_ASM_000153